MRERFRPLVALGWMLIAASSAAGSDYYVDARAGNDSNSGVTPAEAWEHISFALSTVPSGSHVVHLAPGTYGTGGGELYPLPIRSGIELVGDGGSALTVLEGGWFEASGSASSYVLHARGLTLRGGDTGVRIFLFHEYWVELELTDVQIVDMLHHGIYVDAYDPATDGYPWCSVELRNVRVSHCGAGAVVAFSDAPFGEADLLLNAVDCEFTGCAGWGVKGGSASGHCCGSGSLNLLRCRVTDNAAGGVWAPSGEWDGTWVNLQDSLIVDNHGDGLRLEAGGILQRSTIANNLGAGVLGSAQIENSILEGNGDDLASFAGTVTYSCVNDPDTPPGVGNITADPLFVDAPAGDYSLTFQSPCLDAGNPTEPPVFADVDGTARPIDGNLDSVERIDMGALEFSPLGLSGVPHIGTTVSLDFWGPPNGSSILFWTRGPIVRPPLATVFGDWDLDPLLGRHVFTTSATAPGPPVGLQLPIPDLASLVGRTISFQALSTSTSLNPPWALTNPVSLTFIP